MRWIASANGSRVGVRLMRPKHYPTCGIELALDGPVSATTAAIVWELCRLQDLVLITSPFALVAAEQRGRVANPNGARLLGGTRELQIHLDLWRKDHAPKRPAGPRIRMLH